MMFTDTHCHLADKAFTGNLSDVLNRATEEGVSRFIVPSASAADFDKVSALSDTNGIHIAFGIHPWFAGQACADDLVEVEKKLLAFPRAWVGEIGLDFYDKALTEEQKRIQIDWFQAQLLLAEKLIRPVILHNLKSSAVMLAVLKESGFSRGGIVHAFSGSLEEAQGFIRCGLKIGIGSLLLNPTAKKVRLAAERLPLDKMVLETDSPFMLKDSVNEPANVAAIAEIIAEIRGISVDEIAEQTERNVAQLLDF
ncbi:TatD family hydrolase [Neisseria weaveri]|uniref:TatD family hydrolase n=1 Tax=Neisseria weaveri TaxID=28091 RepID=UPI001900C2C6|nr:TatD family hydrolase [Neisseria weaveri]